jgi:hypothetical protein
VHHHHHHHHHPHQRLSTVPAVGPAEDSGGPVLVEEELLQMVPLGLLRRTTALTTQQRAEVPVDKPTHTSAQPVS